MLAIDLMRTALPNVVDVEAPSRNPLGECQQYMSHTKRAAIQGVDGGTTVGMG